MDDMQAMKYVQEQTGLDVACTTGGRPTIIIKLAAKVLERFAADTWEQAADDAIAEMRRRGVVVVPKTGPISVGGFSEGHTLVELKSRAELQAAAADLHSVKKELDDALSGLPKNRAGRRHAASARRKAARIKKQRGARRG